MRGPAGRRLEEVAFGWQSVGQGAESHSTRLPARGVVFADSPFPVYTREFGRGRERERVFRCAEGAIAVGGVSLSLSLSGSRFDTAEVEERQLTRA